VERSFNLQNDHHLRIERVASQDAIDATVKPLAA